MNTKVYQTLEFDKIQNALSKQTTTSIGKTLALTIQPLTDEAAIESALTDVDDVAHLFQHDHKLPIGQLADIQGMIKRLEIGANLNGKELAAVGRVLQASVEVIRFFTKMAEADVALQQLYDYSTQFADVRDLAKTIQGAIAADGSVYDEASPQLHSIRQAMKREERNIRAKLEAILKSGKAQYLSDQLITIRNDRFVLPVKQEYRRTFGGVVHDQSATGQTLFIEPQTVLESNNNLSSLRSQERDEIQRIFADLSALLAPQTAEIQANNRLLGYLDFVQAKFLYALALKATRPLIAKSGEKLYLKQAIHPFLDREVAVANDIYYADTYRMILITGPNTGGKTVTLRTVGILQLMAQAGLYITAESESRVEVFNDIFADIGDEQSIEQNLSTFSGHMTNIIDILNQADDNSLVLIDELGSGTDPQEGASLAIAILNRFAFLNCTVMATTHYPELKAYAYDHPSAINASMEFNEHTLAPTYRLLIGVPGRSNAFDISARLGLPAEIVAEARSYTRDESRSLNEMLLDLETIRQSYENKEGQLAREMAEADQLLQELRTMHQNLLDDKEKYLARAKKEANEIVAAASEKSSAILGEIRQWQTDHPQIGHIKEHEMIAKQKEMQDLTHAEKLSHNKVLKRAKREKADISWQVGDEVKVLTYGQNGVLVEKRSDTTWVVQMGILKMEMDQKDLELLAPSQTTEKQQPRTRVKATKSKNASTELDLRGQRYEEAMHNVDQFIDAALLSCYGQATIIHGHGTGALREGVHKYLKGHRNVESFDFAPYNLGGHGATIVKFKG